MVAEFMWAAGQKVQLKFTYNLELINRKLTEFMFHLGETYDSKGLTDVASGLTNLIHQSLQISLALGLKPHPMFTSLTTYLERVKHEMKVCGYEIHYEPLVIRNSMRCEQYKVNLTRRISKFPGHTHPEQLTIALERIIEGSCAYAMYLGLPLPDVFDEVHRALVASVTLGHAKEKPELDSIIFS